jgi:hypothetical protein
MKSNLFFQNTLFRLISLYLNTTIKTIEKLRKGAKSEIEMLFDKTIKHQFNSM